MIQLMGKKGDKRAIQEISHRINILLRYLYLIPLGSEMVNPWQLKARKRKQKRMKQWKVMTIVNVHYVNKILSVANSLKVILRLGTHCNVIHVCSKQLLRLPSSDTHGRNIGLIVPSENKFSIKRTM